MDVYRKLDVIDDFEDEFGNREAVKRSSDLMISYLAATTRPLPESAAQAVGVAMNYKNGAASLAELYDVQKMIARFMSDHRLWAHYDNAENCVLHAVHAAMNGYLEPSWPAGASELISNFWDAMEKFERDEELLLRLLDQYFS
jgi:hypothetical protein